MPISKLMRSLSTKLSDRSQQPQRTSVSSSVLMMEATPRSSAAMDCSTSFEVVAEVVPRSGGSPAGSTCSGSDAGRDTPVAGPQQQQQQQPRLSDLGAARAHAGGSSAALLASSSTSMPLPGLSQAASLPATTSRALRARGKAMLRTESGITSHTMEHAHSLDSSSSSMDVTTSLATVGSLGVASPRFKRATTAPLPGPAAAGGGGAAALPPAEPLLLAAGRAPKPGTPGHQAAAAVEEEEEDDLAFDDDLLVPPPPPAGEEAAAGEHGEGLDGHCHWEDGVVASWLQGIDHSELLHAGEDEGEEAAEAHQHQQAACAPSCSKAAAGAQGVGAPGQANIYSSMLYN